MQKVIAIVGPTGAGKTSISIRLAQKFNGAVLSADSRQIYEGLDVGSNKINSSEMENISHFGIDCADPKTPWAVSDFQTYGRSAIEKMSSEKFLPFIVGGSGLYVESVLFDTEYPDVPQNEKLRESLRDKTTEELYSELVLSDPERASRVDKNNRVRLIRALEIIDTLGHVPPFVEPAEKYDCFWIGLDLPDEELKKKLEDRFFLREKDIYMEIQTLLNSGVDSTWLQSLGIEYRYGTQCVLGEISKEEAKLLILRDSWRLVHKQRTWWKRRKNIHWYTPGQYADIENDLAVWYSANTQIE